MKRKIVVILLCVVCIVAGLGLLAHGNKGNWRFFDGRKNNFAFNTSSGLLAANNSGSVQPVDFEKAAANAVPSVVHINTTIKFKEADRNNAPDQDPFGDMFGNDFFKKFFGYNGRQFKVPNQKGSGSGVIISPDGYIVTNDHVVDGATEVKVTLNDHKDYTAKVIGTDPNTDLALLKIDARNLPAIVIGNSDDVKLGEWVLAIGYPLNLEVTVTQGIVSAKSRNIGINTMGSAPIEAFIQTDAAVNPGSSGGALVNTNGELIAINSAIASPTGSFAGYAYAIPSNLMKKVVDDIMKYGSVQRGYLGISMAPENLDDAKKKELGINDNINAVWIMDVDPKGAAAEAGIKKGDAIIKMNGNDISSDAQLAEMVARQKPGDKIQLTIMRGSKQMNVDATLKNKLGVFPSMETAAVESLGADFTPLNKADASKLGIDGGLTVSNIRDGVISNQTNMRPGFIITKVAGVHVKTVDDLKQALMKQNGNFQIEGIYPGSNVIYYYGINDFRK
ncbi:MAG TPA: trypsin-like peptidase domain-containing protein [Puia sp.]|nr:trypsin-like peptidase domain-containing protein [Puia sp.]